MVGGDEVDDAIAESLPRGLRGWRRRGWAGAHLYSPWRRWGFLRQPNRRDIGDIAVSRCDFDAGFAGLFKHRQCAASGEMDDVDVRVKFLCEGDQEFDCFAELRFVRGGKPDRVWVRAPKSAGFHWLR